jgi:hypothetical protein
MSKKKKKGKVHEEIEVGEIIAKFDISGRD